MRNLEMRLRLDREEWRLYPLARSGCWLACWDKWRPERQWAPGKCPPRARLGRGQAHDRDGRRDGRCNLPALARAEADGIRRAAIDAKDSSTSFHPSPRGPLNDGRPSARLLVHRADGAPGC